MNTDKFQNSDDLVIEDTFPEDKIYYSSYSAIYDNLYNDIKNNNQMSNYVIGLLLEMRHVINNTKNKSIVISRLLKQTDDYTKTFQIWKKVQIYFRTNLQKYNINYLINEKNLF